MRKIIFLLILSLFPLSTSANYYDDYKKYEKVIKVNTFAEKLSYYEKGEKISEFDISSGDYNNQTPSGRFRIMTKNEFMYSKSAGKWMPYWLEFYGGVYGIHGLPTNYNKKAYKTNEEVIGSEDSGGCVRVGDENIVKLYNWADLGTVVLISYDIDEYNNEGKGEEVINNYFSLINEKKYNEAFNLKKNKKYSINKFVNIYNNIEVKNIAINLVNDSKFETKVDLYKNGKLIARGVKSIFYINDGKIMNSYVLK